MRMLPDGRTRDAAEPADDDDDEREQEDVGVRSGPDRQRARRGDAGQAREPGPDDEHDHEEPIDVDAHRARDLAVVHAGADERPEPRVVLDEVQAHADEHGEPDEEEAIGRVRDRAKVERARDRRRGLDRARIAPERCQAEVGHDERDADRDEHLGQLLAADPAQEESLGHEPDGRGDGDPDGDRRDEVARSSPS